MPARRRKKNVRIRGTRTCGWGLCHRGKGNKGGVGRAGGGKKADCKKFHFDQLAFGKHGFKSKGTNTRNDVAISIRDLEEILPSWENQKLVEKKEGVYIVDLKKIGYDKLLSEGTPTKKMKISVQKTSANVAEKLKKNGCELVTA